jgi:hypothetical protein
VCAGPVMPAPHGSPLVLPAPPQRFFAIHNPLTTLDIPAAAPVATEHCKKSVQWAPDSELERVKIISPLASPATVGPVSFLGDAHISLGDAKSSLGDAHISLGDAKSSLGDAHISLGDAKSSLGDAKSSLGDAKSSLGDAKSSLGDAKSSLGDAKS